MIKEDMANKIAFYHTCPICGTLTSNMEYHLKKIQMHKDFEAGRR